MPGIHIPNDQLLSRVRFQRSYLWDVLLPDITSRMFRGAIPNGPGGQAGIPTFGLIGFALAQLVRNVQFGDYSMNDIITMRAGPYQAHFAGLLTVNDIIITFNKTAPDAVSTYINEWKKLMVDPVTGLFLPKSSYQKTIYIRFLYSEGLAIGRYKFIGCFPRIFPRYSMDYDNDLITTTQVTFAVDKVEYEAFG